MHFSICFQCTLVITFCYFPVLSTLTSSVHKIKNSSKRNNAWQCPVLTSHRSCLWADASTEASHEREARETTSKAPGFSSVSLSKTKLWHWQDAYSCGWSTSMCYCLPPAVPRPQVHCWQIKQGTHVRATSWALPVFHQLLLHRANLAKRSTSFQPPHLCTWIIHHT